LGAGAVVGGAGLGVVGTGFGLAGAGCGAGAGPDVAVGAEAWPAGRRELAAEREGAGRDEADAEAAGTGWLGPGEADGAGLLAAPVDPVLATVLAAVRANRLAIPNAPTRLSRAARNVMREILRRPKSRAAPRSRCLMPSAHQFVG
jgi:hypothetical protein